MAWFAFNQDSARSLQNSSAIRKMEIAVREGNPLTQAMAAGESILILPGSVAEAPFLLHIQNRSASQPAGSRKKWWKVW